ncbi:MAG: prolyl oligopeptidase family serine peptidase [Paenibacillaceae bacterium]|nr:prolyl oligopeptidase family serine peptidase [Paenibacillaceae bacterium]
MNELKVAAHKLRLKEREMPYYVREPETLNDDPQLLLTFAMDWRTSLLTEPYCIVADMFVAAGHRSISFDLPCHGDRIDSYGVGIDGFAAEIAASADPFTRFVAEAGAVIDACIESGLAKPGRIALCGTSRGGYMALRLMAADSRIAAVAAFAPVTDWNALSEFAALRGSEAVGRLRLAEYVDGLAGRKAYILIGNRDARVDTASCCAYYAHAAMYYRSRGWDEMNIAFYCTDDAGHTVSLGAYRRGGDFLLNEA